MIQRYQDKTHIIHERQKLQYETAHLVQWPQRHHQQCYQQISAYAEQQQLLQQQQQAQLQQQQQQAQRQQQHQKGRHINCSISMIMTMQISRKITKK